MNRRGTGNGERGTGAFHPVPLLALMTLMGCRGTLSPLSNRIKACEEAFVVLVADGEADTGDLFAVPASGGTPYQVTFTRVNESLPALSPDGSVVAFARGGLRPEAPVSVALLNLVNGAERRIDLPPGTVVRRLGWSGDGTEVFIRTDSGDFAATAPPGQSVLHPVPASESALADSALAVLLGDPPFASAVPCTQGGGLCARADTSESVLDPEGSGPLRWGGDSVAFFVGNALVVRPLGPGRVRRVEWNRALGHPREASYTAGPVER